jgi:hypothetical protein
MINFEICGASAKLNIEWFSPKARPILLNIEIEELTDSKIPIPLAE